MNNGNWGIFFYTDRGDYVRTTDNAWCSVDALNGHSTPMLFASLGAARLFAKANKLLQGVFIRPIASPKSKEGML